MCTVCGCSTGETAIEGAPGGKAHHHHHGDEHQHGPHDHDDHHRHDHFHDADGLIDYGSGPARAHAPGLSQARMIEIERGILSKNDGYAAINRTKLAQAGAFAINLLAGPGAGKTTLLVKTLERLLPTISAAVIEGDQQTSNDADRIRATGAPAIQINTGKGCHLDAHMVGHAMERLALGTGSVLFIENVGNLVCPAAFDVGECRRVTLISVTDGEDKPLKYPDIFEHSELVIVTKADLVPHLDVDLEALTANIARIAPEAAILTLSARTGDGMEEWIGWLGDNRRDWLNGLAREAEARAAEYRMAE